MTGRAKFTVNPYLHTALTIVAGLLLLAGGAGLLITIGVDGAHGREVDCGSVATGLHGSVTYDPQGTRAADVAANVATCESALGARRAWAWPAAALGVLGLVLVVLLARFVHPVPRWWTEQVDGGHR